MRCFSPDGSIKQYFANWNGNTWKANGNVTFLQKNTLENLAWNIIYCKMTKPSLNCITLLRGNTDHLQLCFVKIIQILFFFFRKPQWKSGYWLIYFLAHWLIHFPIYLFKNILFNLLGIYLAYCGLKEKKILIYLNCPKWQLSELELISLITDYWNSSAHFLSIAQFTYLCGYSPTLKYPLIYSKSVNFILKLYSCHI